MTVQPNGTDAKDIALHFVKVTTGRATPAIISKTVIQAKTLLQSGYTKDEIIKVIDYLIDVKKVQMYSLGYVGSSINSVLKEIQVKEDEECKKLKSEQIKKEVSAIQETQRSEVTHDGESTQRNRDKLDRFGNESRFGKKFNFNMFEGQRQDD